MLAEVLFCESDGRVLGGMQFGVLEEPGARGHAVWGVGGGAVLRE